MKRLHTPLTEAAVRDLKVGDQVLITGLMFTGRDAVHKWLYEGNTPPVSEVNLKGGVIYHCGPVMLKKGKEWKVTAAGPTTSSREEPYQATIIEKFGVRAVIGKGGMGAKTKEACQKFGCVYLHAVGGAAQVLAQTITKVEGVFGYEEFGSPEAIWKLQVVEFPAVVTIDSHGNSLHQEMESSSKKALDAVFLKLK